MKKILSFCLILIVIACLSVVVFAEKTVNIVKTDIKADRVVNNEGLGSIVKDAVYEDDGETLISMPEAALIDKNGYFVFPYKKTWLEYNFYDGIVSLVGQNAYVQYYLETGEKDEVGFYNLNGESLFSSDSFWGASAMVDGYAFVTKADLNDERKICAYLIDTKGNVVLDLQNRFTEILGKGFDDFAKIVVSYSVANWFSNGLLPCQSYDSIEDYYDGEMTIFYLDTSGEVVLSFPKSTCIWAHPFWEELALVTSSNNRKCGYIDKTGTLVIPCEYDTAGGFFEGLACVSKNGKHGYINKKNEIVIPLEYDETYGAACGLAAVARNGKCGLVDYDNNVVVPLEYDDISSFENNVAYATKDGYVYIITIGDIEVEPVITVNLDGAPINFDQPPIIQNDRTLVPLRAIFEALGAKVDWDDATQTVTSTKGATTIKITIGDNKLYKNSSAITLDVPAQIVNDRTLVPVRAISEAFGCKVDWVDETQTVLINSVKETPAPTSAPATPVTTGQKNALKSAQSYLKHSSFSYKGLIDQLIYEGFTEDEAKYGADNCAAGWYGQALKSAQSYLKHSSFSYKELVDQLLYEGFTDDEAKYGVDNSGANWYEQALKSAQSYLKHSSFSYKGLLDQLLYEGFTDDEAKYGVDNCAAGWYGQAVKSAQSCLKYSAYSYKRLVDQLIYKGFTEDEAKYGVDNSGANWYEQAIKSAQSHLKYSSYSYKKLIDQLIYEGFSEAEAKYGADNCGANW